MLPLHSYRRREQPQMRRGRSAACALVLCLSVALGASRASGQAAPASANSPSASNAASQAVTESGLLPLYGIDFTFDPAWVDGSRFPSVSADYPNTGVKAPFQQVWDALKPSGFNILRFPIDVRDAASAANRVANLCVWAKSNGVRMVPILVGADRGQPVGADFAANCAGFVKALIGALKSAQQTESYGQILAYQLEAALNHPALHGPALPQAAQIAQAAGQLRQAEQQALKDLGISASPLMVAVSFDAELIRARAMAGADLKSDAYAAAYDGLKRSLADLAASQSIDLIDVDWFAGSVGAGGQDRFAALLGSLTADLPGKQIVLTTGCSTGFRPADEQKRFYTESFTTLAAFRARAGVDSPFVGVIFHEALNGPDPNPAPAAGLPDAMQQWDRAAKADELAQVWAGKTSSEALAWWFKKVDNNFGLVSLSQDSAGSSSISTQPAQQSLTQISAAISDAAATSATAVPTTPTTPTAPPAAPGAQPTTPGTRPTAPGAQPADGTMPAPDGAAT